MKNSWKGRKTQIKKKNVFFLISIPVSRFYWNLFYSHTFTHYKCDMKIGASRFIGVISLCHLVVCYHWWPWPGVLVSTCSLHGLVFHFSILWYYLFITDIIHFRDYLCRQLEVIVVISKALWDNHINCLSCSSHSRFSMGPTCRNWPSSMWDLADKRGLYNTRCRTMAKMKTLSKKKKDSVNSEFSEDILQEIMGSPSRMALLPGGKTHKGGSSENEWTFIA